LLACAVLLLTAWNAWRAVVALQDFAFMSSLGQGTVAILLFVIGSVWAIGFAIATYSLWRLRAWGRYWTMIAIAAYQLHLWIERLTLERTSAEQLTRPADFVLSVLIVIAVWGFLFLPKIRRVFQA
jgi:hypothetical protein